MTRFQVHHVDFDRYFRDGSTMEEEKKSMYEVMKQRVSDGKDRCEDVLWN